ncbi:retrovirus-related Pol polyprotein from transposon TNT 1-94, partial [Trifolium pratense]
MTTTEDSSNTTPPPTPTHSTGRNSSHTTPSATSVPVPIHPALTVPNITNFIKITLSMENGQYNTWSELFKIHARVFEVIDHIIPPSPTPKPETPSLKESDYQLWRRLDAVVLQWIYGTISNDLLNTIIEHDSTA